MTEGPAVWKTLQKHSEPKGSAILCPALIFPFQGGKHSYQLKAVPREVLSCECFKGKQRPVCLQKGSKSPLKMYKDSDFLLFHKEACSSGKGQA